MNTKNTKNIEFREIKLKEISAVSNLFNEKWRINHIFYRKPEVLKWQYYENPIRSEYTDDMTLLGVFIDDVLYGVHGYIPFIFNYYGKKRRACHFCNWYASPEIRRGPIGIRLTTDVLDQYNFQACFGYAFSDFSRFILKRIGWNIEQAFPRYVRITNIENTMEMLNDMANNKKFYQYLKSTIIKTSVINNINNYLIEEIENFNNLKWDNFFWNKLSKNIIGPARDKKYLIWRYKKIPIFKYHILYASNHLGTAGLLIYRIEEVKNTRFKVIRITDILATTEVVEIFAKRVIEIAINEDIAFVDFFCTLSNFEPILQKQGFIYSKNNQAYPVPFLFSPLETDKLKMEFGWKIFDQNQSLLKQKLYYTKADGDFDRPN